MKILLILTIYILTCASLPAQGNYGVLDIGKVIMKMPEHKLAEKLYKKKERILEDSAFKIKTLIDKHIHNTHCSNPDSAMRIEWAKKLGEMNEHQMFFWQTYYPKQKRQWEEQKLKIITQILKYRLMDFMKANQITILIDKAPLVYFDEDVDYTERVMVHLKFKR